MQLFLDIDGFSAFDPEMVAVLHQAYSEACAELKVFAGDERGRSAVAARVIDLARSGVIDVSALRDRVVLEGRLSAGSSR